LGFVWDPLTEQWEDAFALLQKFHKREGHCLVPKTRDGEESKLGAWVSKVRLKKAKLSKDQIARLDSLGFVWDPLTEQWEDAFALLQKFHKQEGHCRVPHNLSVDGHKLGAWVNKLRQRKGKLSQNQLARLDSLDFAWDPLTGQWEGAFALLQKFRKQEGHCRVPKTYEVSGYKLGSWVCKQRLKKNQLTRTQVSRLESLNFTWDPLTEQWEEAFALLQKFHEREGHCRIPYNLSVDGFKLGAWISKQRQKKSKMSPDRIAKLMSLGFEWKP
jgi:virulence-associated protein VagC